MTKWGYAAAALAMFGMATTALADTVTGEVIDTFCYAAMGAKGPTHRACGTECAKKGIPVGLLENNTNKVYILLPPKDKAAVPSAAVDKMGQQATITGKVYTTGGDNFLTVENVK